MKARAKGCLCCVLSLLMICTLALTANAASNVTPTSKWYSVDLDNANEIFISNEKWVNLSTGEAIYLSYTVDSVELDESKQHGVITTSDREKLFPYDGAGYMEFDYTSVLLKEGYTYFVKMQLTDYGLEYAIAYANKNEADYISFTRKAGELNSRLGYCGVWLGSGRITAKLSRVHSYDKNGNNLGVAVTKGRGATVYDPTKMQANPAIEHSYSFSLENATHVAISNERYTDADVIYMEYSVQDVQSNLNQTGWAMTNSPTAMIPHAGGGAKLIYNHIQAEAGSPLAISGATYLIRFERTENGFTALGRYTLNGTTRHFSFPKGYGSYDPEYGYCTLWFGEGSEGTLTAKFENFKCYDDQGNNLAVQTNQSNVEIIHYGGLEDYSKVEALYYCQTNDTFIALYEDKHTNIYVNGAITVKEGDYTIDGLSLLVMYENKETQYKYLYSHIKDADGNKYIRLKENAVKFVTNTESFTVMANSENFFKVTQPDHPEMDGYTFQYWCTGAGTEFDFDTVVTEATTLYAKWLDGDGNEYIAIDFEQSNPVKNQGVYDLLAALGSSAAIVITAGILIWLIKRGEKKREKA